MSRRAPPLHDLFGPVPEPELDDQARKSDLVDVELRRLPDRDTAKAFCVQKSAVSEPVYLPRSLTELHGAVFTFPRWLAVEKGLL
jgi:hypothetical protein